MLGQVAWHLMQHTTGSEDWHPELPHAHTRIHTLPYTHIINTETHSVHTGIYRGNADTQKGINTCPSRFAGESWNLFLLGVETKGRLELGCMGQKTSDGLKVDTQFPSLLPFPPNTADQSFPYPYRYHLLPLARGAVFFLSEHDVTPSQHMGRYRSFHKTVWTKDVRACSRFLIPAMSERTCSLVLSKTLTLHHPECPPPWVSAEVYKKQPGYDAID